MTELFEQSLQWYSVHEADFGQRFERCDGTSDTVHAVIPQDTRSPRVSGQKSRHRFVRGDHFTRIVDRARRGVFALAQTGRATGAASTFGQVFGEGDQRVRRRQDDALTTAADDAALLPGA